MATNYLTKKDLLIEINKSKATYCWFQDRSKHADYHAIVLSADQITDELISEIIAKKASPRKGVTAMIPEPHDVVIRVMDYDHIPDDPERKRKPRNVERLCARTNFPPYKHYIKKDGQLVEVGRSHWRGDLETGSYSITHGRLTERLGMMFLLLVERIARRPNFRGYSYRAEMEGHAIANLCANGLMFDESKSDNPFAFYTTAVNYSFVRILHIEKRNQDMRDTILELAGAPPSISRAIEKEMSSMFGDDSEAKPACKTKKKTVAATLKISD